MVEYGKLTLQAARSSRHSALSKGRVVEVTEG